MITYTLTIFKLGTDISTKPQEVVRYFTFISKALAMDDLALEIKHILKINGYKDYKYLCKLQLRTRNVK